MSDLSPEQSKSLVRASALVYEDMGHGMGPRDLRDLATRPETRSWASLQAALDLMSDSLLRATRESEPGYWQELLEIAFPGPWDSQKALEQQETARNLALLRGLQARFLAQGALVVSELLVTAR